MSDIITVNDLNLWYGPTQALHHVTISVPEHSITALIGPSGCGKSTFLKTLDRMNDLVPGVRIEGEVKYNGQACAVRHVEQLPDAGNEHQHTDQTIDNRLVRQA